MATNAEALKVRGIHSERKADFPRRRRVARAFQAWLMKGQLGTLQSTEVGRYTGARI